MPIPAIPAELGLKMSSHRFITLYLLVFPGLALSLATGGWVQSEAKWAHVDKGATSSESEKLGDFDSQLGA